MIGKKIQISLVLTLFLFLAVHSVWAVDTGSVNGEYIIVGYYSDPWTYISSLTFDGNGSVTYSDIATSDNDNRSGSESYSVDSDGRFKVADAEGVVNSNADVIAFGDFGSAMGVNIAMKKSSGMSNASLTGEYIGVGYYNDPWSNLVSLTFDGTGNVQYNDLATSDNNNKSGTETYSVNADGRFVIAGSDNGMISPDTNVIAWVDTESSSIGIYIAVKKSSGMSNASLNGGYLGVGYYSDPWSNLISLTFDGDGIMAYSDILTSDNNNESGTVTYSVGPGGDFSADVVNGIFSADGDVGIWVDTSSSIGLYIAIKKSASSSDTGSGDGGDSGGGGCFITLLK